MVTVMLVKLTPDSQLTAPKQALEALGSPDQFDLMVEGDRLVLSPTNAIRDRLATEGITEQDIADAIEWARQNP